MCDFSSLFATDTDTLTDQDIIAGYTEAARALAPEGAGYSKNEAVQNVLDATFDVLSEYAVATDMPGYFVKNPDIAGIELYGNRDKTFMGVMYVPTVQGENYSVQNAGSLPREVSDPISGLTDLVIGALFG